MLKLSMGAGLVLVEAVASGFSLSSHPTPSAIGVALLFTAIGAMPVVNQWADALMNGHTGGLEGKTSDS